MSNIRQCSGFVRSVFNRHLISTPFTAYAIRIQILVSVPPSMVADVIASDGSLLFSESPPTNRYPNAMKLIDHDDIQNQQAHFQDNQRSAIRGNKNNASVCSLYSDSGLIAPTLHFTTKLLARLLCEIFSLIEVHAIHLVQPPELARVGKPKLASA